MRVCLLTDNPAHPLLATLPDLLGERHSVAVFNPDDVPTADPRPTADLYLLKAHSPQAVALARQVERLGSHVVNGAAATALCQDRVQMADLARKAGLPFPDTHHFTQLSELSGGLADSSAPGFPLVVKSRTSRRMDLVARLDGPDRLRSLEGDWTGEPVVVQDFIANDGWDYKLWLIGKQVFAGLRHSTLDGRVPTVTRTLNPQQLPPGWLDLARAAGEVFDLRIYGVDILATADGPMVVDVNPFPGCRGVPGAPRALATFIQQAESPPYVPARRSKERRRSSASPVAVLHEAVRDLISALDGGAESGPAPVALHVASVRRKPGRGLTASYRPHDRRGTAGTPWPLVTVLLTDSALADSRVGELLSSADPAEFRGYWPGILRCPRVGLTLQSFPHDADLPTLSAACATSPLDGRLASALTAAARTVLDDPGARVSELRVSPVRYKPAARCVLRYQVRLPGQHELVFFGKLYRDPADAAAAYRLAEQLWAAHDRSGPLQPAADGRPAAPAVVPRPLALAAELGLVITETAGGAHHGGQLAGTALLRPPRRLRAAVGPPSAALAASAAALAWMHTSGVASGRAAPRGAAYAARARRWAQALSDTVHGLNGALDQAVHPLAEALTHAESDDLALVHGAFKPSQLVFCPPCHPVITDLDGVGQGDPALDVGYFLAYLRPPHPELARPGVRGWYEAARDVFLDAYLAALARHGADQAHLAAVRRRAALFDAALLLKVASRRVRRLGSPRPAEVQAVVAEIDRCLERFAEGRDG
ncbi:hypothetical protein [Streptantibioticus ferralitis]|uniref:ATP-grasp domain-containing protein n=1 Tax=Streptantibioticus ferralitis TaxID=236510 RepID=A0ABT5YW69_9ACTN|nr:hypothetical protein [Streptantibioticus ferralitis]MDF2255090.1 hypothetical protein [Streptantibioticus ferralitis]